MRRHFLITRRRKDSSRHGSSKRDGSPGKCLLRTTPRGAVRRAICCLKESTLLRHGWTETSSLKGEPASGGEESAKVRPIPVRGIGECYWPTVASVRCPRQLNGTTARARLGIRGKSRESTVRTVVTEERRRASDDRTAGPETLDRDLSAASHPETQASQDLQACAAWSPTHRDAISEPTVVKNARTHFGSGPGRRVSRKESLGDGTVV